jgi:4-hydroxybenzoate polyprenyltransferase
MIASTSRPGPANVLEAPPASDARSVPSTLAWAHLAPLVNRFRRGEGLLLAVSLSVGLAARPDLPTFLAQALVSAVVMALLYLLNDVYDCRQDLTDPGKDQTLVRFYVQRRGPLLRALAVEHVAAVLLAAALLGVRSATAVAVVLAVNVAYSTVLKGRAVVDVVWVAVWGAACAAVPGVVVPASLLALVGIMTSICHVFQITRDRPIDDVNRIRTSAVAAGWLPGLQLAIACGAMGLVLGHLLGPVAALSAATPLALRLSLKSNQAAWMLSKAYYGAVWLLALGTLRGL